MGSGLGRADEGGPAARRKPLRERRVTGPVSIYDLALENRAEADRD